ncbi:MAG: hypothetical protein IJ240_07045, partial [Clostridia bacterium]|nr:hypothetical protein [Clostridia bacterium]
LRGERSAQQDRAAAAADRRCLAALGVYIALTAALFIGFFPYASGILVRHEWLDAMNWFGNLYY